MNVITTQADMLHLGSIHACEIQGRQFPHDEATVKQMIMDVKRASIVALIDRATVGWASFLPTRDTVMIDSLAIRTPSVGGRVFDRLMATASFVPGREDETTKVQIKWPEHETDSWLFGVMRDRGFRAVKTVRDQYEAYGEKWDAFIMEALL